MELDVNDVIATLTHQRNGALDDAAQQAAARILLERKNLVLEAKVKELEAKLSKKRKPSP